MLDAFFNQYAQNFTYSKKDEGWCYEDGCLYRGLLELHLATGEPVWREHLIRLINRQVGPDGTLRGFRADEYNIDNILAGRVLFHLAETEGERFARAADQLVAQLRDHPRIELGNYWHKQIYPSQVWLDGLYMGLPFQIEYGLTRNQPDLVQDALAQARSALTIMGDPETGLFYHGYDHSRAKAWSHPASGLSKSFWGRAVGWLAMALIDIVALLPEGHPDRAEMAGHCRRLADAVLRFRTPAGLWLQVMDQPDLPGNYEEISGSAMFTYFLLRSARLINTPPAVETAGQVALEQIRAHHVACEDGIWKLKNICEVAGLGPYRDRERDGTPHYYTTEAIVSNDVKGVGPLMMAVAEHNRLTAAADLPKSSSA